MSPPSATTAQLTRRRGLLACTAHLTASLDKSIALERPVHASVVVLLIAGVALLLTDKVRPLHIKSAASGQQYAPIPLSDLGDAHGSRPVSPAPADPPAAQEHRPKLGPKLQCALVAFLLCARIEILRQVVSGSECSTASRETLVPIFIAVADWWFIRRRQSRPRQQDDDNDMDNTVYSDALSGLVTSSWRPLVAIVLLSWSSTAAIARTLPAKSSYICSPTSREYTMIPRLQIAGVLLDGFLAVLLYQLLDLYWPRPSNSVSKGTSCLGLACVVSPITCPRIKYRKKGLFKRGCYLSLLNPSLWLSLGKMFSKIIIYTNFAWPRSPRSAGF